MTADISEVVARLMKARLSLGHLEGHPQYKDNDPIVEVSQADLRALLNHVASLETSLKNSENFCIICGGERDR